MKAIYSQKNDFYTFTRFLKWPPLDHCAVSLCNLQISTVLVLDGHRNHHILRWRLRNRGDICSVDPPKVFENDMAKGQDMPKGPGTEGIMFLSAFVPEIWSKNQRWGIIQLILVWFFKTYNCSLWFYGCTQCIHIFRDC